ncbi:MAG: CoA transferase [Acidimicrobiales bacterium]|nr:CoA transferase [Acidimicrobiales bacterium]
MTTEQTPDPVRPSALPAFVPLAGVTVVAVEQAVAAPLCTARLVDAGARVIKVERAGGDFARGYDRAAAGDSSYFAWANHGKESIVLDLKTEADAALLHRIVAAADVFIQNLAPGALTRAGFGSEQLRSLHPRLITCDISGFGEVGDLAAKKAYDLLIQAESAMIAISGGPGELGRIGVSVCDISTAITAYAAVLEALLARGTTGVGAGLQVSLFDTAAEWMTVPLVQHLATGAGPTRVGLRHPSIAPYGAYRTADDSLTLIAVQNEREWVRLCTEVLGRPDLARDPRFGSNTDRVEHRVQLEHELQSSIGEVDRTTLQDRLAHAGVAYGAVNTLDGLAAHAALRHRTVTATTGATVDLPAHPVRWADHGPPEAGRVPDIGAHTDALRHEFTP